MIKLHNREQKKTVKATEETKKKKLDKTETTVVEKVL